MHSMKISLFICAVLSTAWAGCGCGGPVIPIPAPSPCGCSQPAPAPAPAPVPVPLPLPLPCHQPAPAPAPAPAPCACGPTTTPKPKVFINKQQPIVINRPAQSYEIKACAPVHIRPAPVVIQSEGKSEYRPYVQTITSKPIIVDKKIIKIERPIVKKYYEEKYSKTEPSDCGKTIPLPPPVLPSPCSNAAPVASPMPYVPVPVAPHQSSQLPDDVSALLAGASAYPSYPAAPSPSPCGCGNVVALA